MTMQREKETKKKRQISFFLYISKIMSIIHGLIAHGTTIVSEYKNNKDIDDLVGTRQKKKKKKN